MIAAASPVLNEPGEKRASRRAERLMVLGLIGFLFLLNLATATRYPNIWTDEVMYSDPAARLVMGKGFTSTAWYAQTGDRFWAGNTPLHPLTLSVWIRIFGFSPLAVRALDYFWFALGTFCLWWFCDRAQFLANTRVRLLVIALLAAGSAVSFSYRSARPDMLGFFLVALSLCTTTIPSMRVRYLCLLCAGFLVPWTGLQLLPFLAVAGFITWIFWGWRKGMPFIVAGFGAALGLAGLYAFYARHGVWKDFVASVAPHTTFGSTLGGKLAELPELFMRDRSAPFLLLLGGILLAHAWTIGDRRLLRTVAYGLAAGILIPLAMHFCGLFPIYYGWMAAVPLGLVIGHALAGQTLPRWLKGGAAVLLAGAMAVGLPARLFVAFLRASEQPYSAVEQFVRAQVKNSDTVYADYAAYYPAVAAAREVFTYRYLEVIKPEEREGTTVLVIDPAHLAGVTNRLPGNWVPAAEFKNQIRSRWLPQAVVRRFSSHRTGVVYAPYQLVVYRKEPAS